MKIEMIKGWETKGWFSFLTLIVSAIALAISIKSCYDAKNAIEISQRQFIEENRPYLLIEPVTFKETDSYFKIDRNKDEVKINIRYRVTNIGNTIAKNIIHPSQAVIENHGIVDGLVSKVTPISLGPDQKISLIVWVLFKGKGDDSIDNFIDSYYSGKSHVTHEFPVKYSTELEPSFTYYTIVEHEIYTDHAAILRSEMSTFDRKNTLEGET